MAYATVADLVAEFGEREVIELTDRFEPPIGVIDQAVAQGALDRAGAVIDGYLAGRYALPLAAVPPLLNGIARDLARHALYTSAMPDVVQARYDAAMKSLRAIGDGLMALPLPPAGSPAQGLGGSAVRSRDKNADFESY
jgi:phage gp36-like protein